MENTQDNLDATYVRRDEIGKMITDSVVAGIRALMDNVEVVQIERQQLKELKQQSELITGKLSTQDVETF